MGELPEDHTPPALYGFSGSGFYSFNPPSGSSNPSPEPPPYFNPPALPLVAATATKKPDREVDLAIVLMIIAGLAGNIGVALYFIVEMIARAL